MSAIENDAPDLTYSGRDSNHNLGFRRWSASSHASYYTPVWLAEAIASGILGAIAHGSSPVVLDPTCGSGRLLLPFKNDHRTVLGIELDEEAAEIAKKNIGAKNLRVGDLLIYRKICRTHEWSEGANIVVTNPPFGIWWDVPENEGWETVNRHGKVESQAFTIECATRLLAHNGILAAILPTSTYENEKDETLRQYLFKNYQVRKRVTIEHVFTDEYGIEVLVDLIVGIRMTYGGGNGWTPDHTTIDAKDEDAPILVTNLVREACRGIKLPDVTLPTFPQAKLLVSVPLSDKVTITPTGVDADLAARAMLDFLNETVQEYSPVQGVRTGVVDAFCSPPALIKRGWPDAMKALRDLGVTVDISKRTSDRLDRLRKRYQRLCIPLYPPKPHNLLGYFDDKPYTATADVSAPLALDDMDKVQVTGGKVTVDPNGTAFTLLWRAGQSYTIHPTWIRKRDLAKEETVYNASKDRDETIRTEIDRGYLLLEVQTDHGTLDVAEIDEAAVTLFLKAFPLPVVPDVDELLAVEVDRNRSLLARQSPYLFDYQLEDMARLVTKSRGYIGWEVGGGKTGSSIAWARARQYKRVLVVCESRLVRNWLSECQKFGVQGHRLTSHTEVAAFRERVRRGQKPEGFFITSYEFLSLDGSKTFQPWDCVKYDKDGVLRHEVKGLTSETCECGAAYQNVVKECPTCGSAEQWTGQACRKCGFIAYTYDGKRSQFPAYKFLKKLFPCVIADEAQVAKSKLSLRGQALRSLHARGRLVLTATIFKGFVHDTFHLLSWILGWNNPLFPYTYKGGSKQFLECYGTYKFVTRAFEETLHTGKASIIPEVSSLNLFSRMLAPFMVRRVDGEMAPLPAKHREIIVCPLDPEHARVYNAWQAWAQDRIRMELRLHQDDEVNMGVISRCLWSLRFAASVPTAADHLQHENAPNLRLPAGSSWSKMEEMLRLVRAAQAKGEKCIVTSPLRPLVSAFADALRTAGIPFTPILASTPVDKRFDLVHVFNHDTTPVLLASMGAICRGLNITGANHVIVGALEWSPESLTQVLGRVHRPPQDKEVFEWLLVSEGTIDEDMLDLCGAKYRALKEAIDAEARYRSVADILERAMSAAQLEVARRVSTRIAAVAREIVAPSAPITPLFVPDITPPPIPVRVDQLSLF